MQCFIAIGILASHLPLSDAHQEIFFGTAEDRLDKPVCAKEETVTIRCRDQRHYVVSNEPNHEVWHPHIKDLGGAYVGIGSDQGLTFVAWARSEVAWLLDYDPVVVAVNRIHRAFALKATSPAEFLSHWSFRGRKPAVEIIRKAYRSRADLDQLVSIYRSWRKDVFRGLKKTLASKEKNHWLQDEADYAFVREQYGLGRIRVLAGDLLKRTTLAGINEASRKLEIPVRVIYLSNAEEWWEYTQSFRDSFVSLNVDERTVVLRTLSAYIRPKGGGKYIDVGYEGTWYRYYVQAGLDFQAILRAGDLRRVKQIVSRAGCGKRGICIVGNGK